MQKLIYTLIILGGFLSTNHIEAQGFGSIFRAGLNFGTMLGPVEGSSNGDYEKLGYTTGFHIGVGARYHFDYLKKYGIGMEGNYSQKGATINYDGPSFYVFRNTSGATVTSIGTRKSNITVSQTHIDIPLYAYAKITKGLEISGGVYGSFLVGSKGSGDLTFSGTNPLVNEFTIQLNHNYIKDQLLDYTLPLQGDFINIPIAAQQYQLPTALGAYTENGTRDGNLYKIFDFGLIGGFSIYLNEGLYLGVRAQYGLSNLVNNNMKLQYSAPGTDNKAILSPDKRTNLTFQASVGFSF
jgi:hypothetical protein